MPVYVQVDSDFKEVSRVDVTEAQFNDANLTHSEWHVEDEFDARVWRNKELEDTDWIIPITDHSSRASYITYREALRDWPSTDSFPETKPTRE